MQKIELNFTDEDITSWGGLSILKKMIDVSGYQKLLESRPLPFQGSNRAYDPVQLFIRFMCSLWCGANRYAHLDIQRFDTSFQRLFCWKRYSLDKMNEQSFDATEQRSY